MTVRTQSLVDARSLSKREVEVMERLAEGLTNHEIGRALYIEVPTVKFHLSQAYAKLGVKNRVDAVRVWQGNRARLGLPCPTCGNVPAAPVVIVNDVEYVPKVEA